MGKSLRGMEEKKEAKKREQHEDIVEKREREGEQTETHIQSIILSDTKQNRIEKGRERKKR